MAEPRVSTEGQRWWGRVRPDLRCEASALPSDVLTDDEAEEIRKGIAAGWRGPILLRWLEQLLQDREERRQRERQAERPKQTEE